MENLDDDHIEQEYEKYVDIYLTEMEKWNQIENEHGGGVSFNDMNEPLMSFEQFKACFYGKDHVPAIIKSDGGVITKLEED